MLLRIVKQGDIPDLRVAGTAALNSSLIYRLKVETLFLFERLKEKSFSPLGGEPPLINFPFRYEYSSTSLEDLIEAFRIILEGALERKKEQSSKIMDMEPLVEMDTFQIYLKEALDSFRKKIIRLLENNKVIKFGEFVRGKDLMEKIRSFILLLFLASEGLVELEDTEEDILIWKR
ncbi:MAG: hypothetical protein QXX95_01865 [Nitrososphaerales archaeon]